MEITISISKEDVEQITRFAMICKAFDALDLESSATDRLVLRVLEAVQEQIKKDE